MAYGFQTSFRFEDEVIDIKVFERMGVRVATFKNCETKKLIHRLEHAEKYFDFHKRPVDVREDLIAYFKNEMMAKSSNKVFRVVMIRTIEYTREIVASSYKEARKISEEELKNNNFDNTDWLIENHPLRIETLEIVD
jgi:hypothetical protein